MTSDFIINRLETILSKLQISKLQISKLQILTLLDIPVYNDSCI
jgi:hypothetical protein